MNKAQLVKEVATATGQTLAEANASVEAVLTAIKTGLSSEGQTRVLGFGVFKNVIRKARSGRNPSTGEILYLPEKTVVKFKPFF